MLVSQMPAATHHPSAIVGPDAKLCEVASLLSSEQVNLVVVCDDDGKMVGVIDASDIVRSVSDAHGSLHACQAKAKEVMSTDVVSCSTTESLRSVWATMGAHRLRHLPATDRNGRTAEVVDARDVLSSLFEETEDEEHALLEYFLSLGFH